MFFFFNDTATTEIYTLSLHDALPICAVGDQRQLELERLPVGVEDDVIVGAIHREPHREREAVRRVAPVRLAELDAVRSEEHTSELQSPCNLVCRLLLEKKRPPAHNNR